MLGIGFELYWDCALFRLLYGNTFDWLDCGGSPDDETDTAAQLTEWCWKIKSQLIGIVYDALFAKFKPLWLYYYYYHGSKTSREKPLEQSNFFKLTWNSNPISDIKMDVLNILKWLCVCSFTCERNFSNEKCFNGFSLIYYSIFLSLISFVFALSFV